MISKTYQLIFMVALLISVTALVVFEFTINKKNLEFILLSFCLIYILSLLFLLSIAGVNEINTRTAFYPLMISILYLVMKTKKEGNDTFFRLSSTVLLITIIGFNTIKLINYCKKSYNKGNGALCKDYLQNKNQSLDYALKLIKEKKLSNKQIHTNENKVIPILLDYEILEPLPTNTSWIGNYEQQKDTILLQKEIEILSNQIKKENHIACFFGSNAKKLYYKVYNKQFSEFNSYTINEFNDGIVITSKLH